MVGIKGRSKACRTCLRRKKGVSPEPVPILDTFASASVFVIGALQEVEQAQRRCAYRAEVASN
jgi:hypothetical protein